MSYVLNSSQIIPSLDQRLKDMYFQTFTTEIRNNNKLRTYRLLKTTYNEENYLKITNIRHKIATTRLRISSHKLLVEKGRHNHIPLQQRICHYCNLNEIEDESHFIVDCTLYNNERKILFNCIQDYLPSFRYLDRKEKFTFLMNLDNPRTISSICSYIYNCFKKREEAEPVHT